MSQFTITLERTVTMREVGHVTVEATDLGEAERIARDRVQHAAALNVDWQVEMEDAGRAVVVDVEEFDAAA
ncbi:hypothetical protein MWN33_16865 [Starkeya koreensis]|uniref:DpnD/PcfM-like protein n=1 Tax=Ancylobacter koreensis TaxID=266121 RepID=A0ABT0DQZ9_9HYPH|nr:hypothetical protein [Ancylobacter koreensis]MCK0209707.1 hypothetical protein [Ancylobacter koreensis]